MATSLKQVAISSVSSKLIISNFQITENLADNPNFQVNPGHYATKYILFLSLEQCNHKATKTCFAKKSFRGVCNLDLLKI